ncbi:MAG: ATP-binding protein [Thermodesulfobacteriota bacterium]
MAGVKPLDPKDLFWSCDPATFPFETTAKLKPLGEVVGQTRALKALDFGLGLSNHGYNIYVLGESGTGKASTVKAAIEKAASGEKVPDDWCYVFNFRDPDGPKAIDLPPGKGCELKTDMEGFVNTLKRDIPMVFESKDYERHRDEILEGQQERTKALFHRLEQQVEKRGFVLKKTVSGLAVVPAKDGKALEQEEFDKLPRKEREGVEVDLKGLQEQLGDVVREARVVEKDTKQRIEALDREVAQYVVKPLMTELFEKYKGFEKVRGYLGEVREDVLANIDDFRPREELALPIAGLKLPTAEPAFERYHVNLMVDNRETKGAPVVVETNPTYYNLFGHVEHRIQYGVATTDFTMIKAGAVHRANGGYLVVNALDVLRNIFVYDAIKRMIKTREARIEDVWEQYRLMSSTTLKPAPIPLDIKVVMIGEPYIYYLLYQMDKEYRKLFKVKADFDNRMPRNDDNVMRYAEFIAARCKEHDLLPFDRTGVARVVEYGLRLSSDKGKLSARFGEVENLVVEASHWAGVDGMKAVGADQVTRAWKEMVYRVSKVEDKLREYIEEDTIMVETEGAVVGQVNGIAVLDMGDYAFGKPSRITARTFMGDSGMVNIEREAKMSGRIHNKAHMILSSFLGERFARDFPLTLSATICFEQLYEGIEGDSATCTEVYALLSSLSGVPIKQGIAVTGSMDQRGEVQPVGGINEKIEGVFDVCVAKGLTGSQGVVIPGRNVKNLMLKKEVRDAVADGKFAIYPIDRVDEGLEIVTGMAVGERGEDGKFPEGTVNRLAEKRLGELARNFKAFGRPKAKAKVEKAKTDNNNDNEGDKEK